MKKLTFLLIIAVITSNLFSQSPQKMSYQCVVRNSNGDLVTNQNVGIKISILQGNSNGTVVYQETYNPIPQTNANGLVSVEIGGGVALSGIFSAINWASGTYFLKTETDPTGGTNYTISGTSQLLSVPYALHAKSAENGFSGAWSDITGKPTTFAGYGLTEADGSITNELQALSLSGTQLTLSGGGGTVTLPSSGGGDNWGTQTVVTNNTLTGTGTASSPLAVANTIITPTWANIQSKPVFSTVATSGNFADLLSKPTTLTGYGITDAMSTSHPANGITSANISNWSNAYDWGNHAGLYRPIGYVPSWNEITGKPTLAAVATSGSYTDLIDKPTILGSQWNTSGSNIYYNSGNVGIGTSSPATYIHAHGVPITSRGQLTLSAPAGQDIFLSFYEADIFKAYLWYNVSDQDLRLQNFTAGDLNLNPYGGNVGIGTNTPGSKLEVAGQIKITGGTPAVGQVLTSDGTGLATWEPPAAASNNQIYFEVKRDASYYWPVDASVQRIDFSSNSTIWKNQGNAFNATTSTFTAPEDGIYSFTGAINFENITSGDLIYAYLKAGGNNYNGDFKLASGIFEITDVSMTLYLSQGQTAQLWGYVNDSTPPATVYGNDAEEYAFTYFSGAKVH